MISMQIHRHNNAIGKRKTYQEILNPCAYMNNLKTRNARQHVFRMYRHKIMEILE